MTEKLDNNLFTMRDFVRPEEKTEYEQICQGLQADLNATGALEETYAMAIIGATWRLRRCSRVESEMSEIFSLDPMEDEAGSRIQRTVDRARGQAFNILRHATAELRRLQTERALRKELSLPPGGIAISRDVIRGVQASLALNCKSAALNCKPAASNCKSAKAAQVIPLRRPADGFSAAQRL